MQDVGCYLELKNITRLMMVEYELEDLQREVFFYIEGSV
jgi:hypothetical protein